MVNLQIYQGKIGKNIEKELGLRVVRDLLIPHFSRKIPVDLTCDNFFCTLKLSYFLGLYGSTVTGTIGNNRSEVPEMAKEKKIKNKDGILEKRKRESTIIFSKNQARLVSYMNNKGKNVLLLTSRFHLNHIYNVSVKCGKEKIMKPSPILEYNKKMGMVDSMDETIKYHSCRRKTSRWTTRVFYDLVDICAYNAYKSYKFMHKHVNKQISRKMFIRKLCFELVSSDRDNQ